MAKGGVKPLIHFPRKEKTKRGNYIMFCGKRFSSGDRPRLRKHVTGHLEDITCESCTEEIVENLGGLSVLSVGRGSRAV